MDWDMGGHWQYHYIYGDQKKTREGRCAAFGSADIKFSTGPLVVRSSVRKRRGKREGERGGGVDKISLPARNDNEDELDVLEGRYIFCFTQCENLALLSCEFP